MRGVNTMLNQLCGSRINRYWRALSLLTFVLLLTSSFAWSAESNKLNDVSVELISGQPAVVIQTSEPVGYRYTVYDSFDPTRVVIDFPGMQIASAQDVLPVNSGSVKEVRTAGFELSSGQLARVEILLEEATDYQVNLDGKKFAVAFATEAAVATVSEKTTKVETVLSPTDPGVAASILSKVDLAAGKAVLLTDGKLNKIQHFVLSSPPRLVVDVYGVKPAFKERSFNADSGFSTVRIGTYKDKTRLVFDASGANLPEHMVDGRETDIVVTWGVKGQKVVEEKSAETVTAVSTQEQVVAKEPESQPVQSPVVSEGPVKIESIDFSNDDGRSIVNVELSGPAKLIAPAQEGNLVRFEIRDAQISRALRRTIDASAFPSAVTSVTPYTVTDGDKQNVRIAVDLKGTVPYALEEDGTNVRLVIDDGAFSEPAPPSVSQVGVVAPETPIKEVMTPSDEEALAPATDLVTADQMAEEAARYTGEKITLVFDSANVRSILQLIGDVSGLNILASGDVKGDVTLRLIDVPWDQALDLVLDTANLGKIQQGNVLRIMPKDKIREIEQADMKEQIVEMEEGVLESRLFSVNHASVDDMKGFLTDIASDRGSIIADSRNKQLIIRDVASVLEQMDEMINQIDKPERQVMIEARIVEATTTFTRNLGVKWGANFDQTRGSNGTDPTTQGFAVEEAALGLGGAFAISPAIQGPGIGASIAVGALEDRINLDLRLSALESSGEGRIISTPRITTLNGESATISQGTKIPFSTVGDSGTDVTFENAELKLAVTPEINPDGSILLDIDASNSSVGATVPTATGTAVSIDEKKAQTKVLVRDGQTTVIGGIFIEQENDSESGVPILKDVPVLGHLFKSTTKTKDRRELLIFITPRIVSQ